MSARAQDAAAPDPARDLVVESSVARVERYVGETVRLTVRIGVEPGFLRDSLLQSFQRRLDVPVRVESGGLEKLQGATLDGAAPSTAAAPDDDRERATFALDDQVASAVVSHETRPDGRVFTMLEFERTLRPTQAGDLVLPAPRLRVAWATRFDDDFLRGRVAADRHDAVVEGRALTLHVVPLPEAGRPPGFTGAIGRFLVTATADRRDLAVGESLHVALRIEGDGNGGDGNLATFDPPPLPDLAGFHVWGRIDERTQSSRTFTFDLTPLDSHVTEIPPLAFASFDPEPPGQYRSTTTAPIPITVRPSLERAPPIASDPTAATVAAEPDPASAPTSAPTWMPWGTALALAFVAALALATLTRRRAKRRASPNPQADTFAAAAAFRAAAAPDSDLAQPLATYLAARLRCPPAAVIAPDLESRLRRANVPPELAATTARLLHDLVAARYRGLSTSPPSIPPSLIDDLERAFSPSESG